MSFEPTIRAAEVADIDVMVLLHAASFDDAWPRHVLAPSLSMPGSFAVLGQFGDEPAGFGLARVHAGEGEIMTLCVAPDRRRSGLGKALVAAILEKARTSGAVEIFLEVAADNAAAQALYRGFGFVEVGGRQGYYERAGGRVDALVLRRAF